MTTENQLTFTKFAQLCVKRYEIKKADTVVFIYGLPRTGKTMLGFNILIPYLRLKRLLFRLGKSAWDVPNSWKRLFKDHFGIDSEDTINKLKATPEGSFEFNDEGLDVASWHGQMEKPQQDMIELLMKTGKGGRLVIVIIPSIQLMTKSILQRGRYLLIIPSEPFLHNGKRINRAFLLKNYDNPILAEYNPFGILPLIKKIIKYPKLGEKDMFEANLRRLDTYVDDLIFKPIKASVYALYEQMIKNPSIENERKRRKVVSFDRFQKLQYAFDVALYRLYNNDKKSIQQIKNILTDKFGNVLASDMLIRNHVNKMEMTMAAENVRSLEDPEEEKSKKTEELEDISVEDEVGEPPSVEEKESSDTTSPSA